MAEHLDEKIEVITGETPPAEPAPEAETIGNYRVLHLLGKGGMGAVYEVEHQLLNQKFALKILAPDRIPDSNIIERFRAEAKAVSGLEHAGLLRMYEFGISENGQPFLVTDLFPAPSLSEMLKQKNTFSTSTIAQIIQQCASALAHAHDRGVLHRDIKPSNILVKTDDAGVEIKIIDFGIAKKGESCDGAPPTLTATGEILGTPQYMSPEQCQGMRLDARSDIYSLGCVLYQLLTGEPPFESTNPMAIMFQHLNEVPKEIRTNDKAKASLAAIAMRCLAKDRDRRYASMEELLADVNKVAGGATIRATRYQARKRSKQEAIRFYIFVSLVIPTAIAYALMAATFEKWAPGVVLYSNIPLMDRSEAEARHAVEEANRLRNSARKPDGSLDMHKLSLAENMLIGSAVGTKQWNLTAADHLAQILALEGKYGDVEKIAQQLGGNKPLSTALNLHSLGAALDHGGFHAQAWPLMNKSHSMYVQLVGENDPRTIKELYNMAAADYNAGNRERALQEFQAVLPKLKLWNPSLEQTTRAVIQELSQPKQQ